mmetsp:Transcript_12090/g.24044  ORF Transcript_12090/g.24044 Transcript_12090/m.24044 type:complete len:209 (-) Transcript_12090:16-642(-)
MATLTSASVIPPTFSPSTAFLLTHPFSMTFAALLAVADATDRCLRPIKSDRRMISPSFMEPIFSRHSAIHALRPSTRAATSFLVSFTPTLDFANVLGKGVVIRPFDSASSFIFSLRNASKRLATSRLWRVLVSVTMTVYSGCPDCSSASFTSALRTPSLRLWSSRESMTCEARLVVSGLDSSAILCRVGRGGGGRGAVARRGAARWIS